MRQFTFFSPVDSSGKGSGSTGTTGTSSTGTNTTASTTTSDVAPVSNTGSGDSPGAKATSDTAIADGSPSATSVKDQGTADTTTATDTGAVVDKPAFDIDTWDGDEAKLDDIYAKFAKRHREIVGKEYDERISGYEQKLAGYKDIPNASAIQELRDNLKLYKDISEGSEDPRLKEYDARIQNLMASNKATTDKNAALEAMIEEFELDRERAHYREFAGRHKAIFSDPDKKKGLITLVESGIHEEAAAQLVSQPDSIVAEVRQLIETRGLPESSHELAVEIVLGRHGIGGGHSTGDSPSAILTSGADGSYSNRSGLKNINVRELSLDQARNSAVNSALKVVK